MVYLQYEKTSNNPNPARRNIRWAGSVILAQTRRPVRRSPFLTLKILSNGKILRSLEAYPDREEHDSSHVHQYRPYPSRSTRKGY